MDSSCFKFILILALFERIRCLPLVCFYNGTSYKEGENVETEEPCLSCLCRRGALECGLRVCAEYPNVLPPTCFLVHKPKDCCPQLLCEERFTPTEFELRTGFKLETKTHGNDCVINGSIYAEGSAIASSQVCEYCYCVEGEMKCIKPRCIQSFENCKAVYDKSSCCPTHYDCRNADVDYLKTQIENFAKMKATNSSDFLLSSSSANFTSEEEYFSGNETTNNDLTKTEDTEVEEYENTTSKEIDMEDTTTEPVKESTVPLTEDWVTTIGFNTTKGDNFNEESTKAEITEATTFESETDANVSTFTVIQNPKEASSVQTRSKVDFQDEIESSVGNSDNSSSQDVEDYDSYDYSEPRLPPSLPNLVIFPFVAADAVVKEENADIPGGYDPVGIKRIDAHPVFYKDYFSPPVKTEGGFVPKEPSNSDESFYKYAYHREQIEPPSADLKENPGAQIQTNASPLTPSGNCVSDGREIQQRNFLPTSGDCVTCTCQRGAVVCQDVVCSHQKPETITPENQEEPGSFLESYSNTTFDSYKETVRPYTETFDFTMTDNLTQSHEKYQTKKPVTVTYKNFVVDYFPNYLITTTRGHFKLQSVESAVQKTPEETLQQKTQNVIVPLTTIITPSFNFSEEPNTSISTRTTEEITTEGTEIIEQSTFELTTAKTSLFEEFVKSFLSKDTSSSATGNVTAKHKYSSKIKSQITATVKPKQEEVKEKLKPETSKVNSTNLYSWLNSIMKPVGVTEKAKNFSATQKPVKKEDSKQSIKISLDQLTSVKPEEETKNTDFSEFPVEEKPSSESKKDSVQKSENGYTTIKSNAEAFLKLAGCNIYGMMYRVGKIITELSGPCLECLCTELGVQCRPLEC